MSRWNQWVEEQGGEGKATLAETRVGKLACRAEGYQYQVQEGSEGLDLERRQRQGLLKSLELNRPGRNAEKRFFERVRHLKELTHEFLTELYTLRRVINFVTQLYLEGLARLMALLPNGDSQKSVEPFSLDLSTLDELTEQPAKHETSYLEDRLESRLWI